MNNTSQFLSTGKLLLKTALLLPVFCTLLLINTVKAQETITLQQAIELTLQNNIQIKQVTLNELVSKDYVLQSKLSLLPTINASNSLNFNFGRSVDPLTYQFVNNAVTNANGSVSTNVALFQGFQKLNLIAQNKYQLEADKSNTRKIKNDLLLSVVTNYLLILNNSDLVLAAQQQLEISNQQLDRIQKLFDVGNNTLADLSQGKAQVASSELNLTNTQNQLDVAYLNLAQLMERDPTAKYVVVAPVVDQVAQISTNYNASEIFNRSVENYPDIRLAEYNTLVSQKQVQVAKGALYPRLSLGATLNTGYSDNRRRSSPSGGVELYPFSDQLKDNFNQSIGFSLSIPVFNGLTSKISVRRAKIGLQNAELSEQLAKNNLNKIINQAVLDLRAAEKSYISALSAFNSSRDAFNVVQQRYTVGLINSLDFNQAQINQNTSEFNLIQAKYNMIFRAKVIDYYQGNPITF